MRKLVSLGLITFAAFFMSACDFIEDAELDGLPGIELAGESVMEVLKDSEFVDPGAQILGGFDLEVVTVSDVDTSILGDYTVTYTISYLEIEYVVSRTVSVVEVLSGDLPGLEFVGNITMEVLQYSTFVDPGVGIIGEYELDIVVVSDVDTSVLGSYSITYTITYLENEYSLTRTVEVVDTLTSTVPLVPSIELVGEASIVIEQGSVFTDPGVTVTSENSLVVNVDSNVDVNTLGVYSIVYSVTYEDIVYSVTRSVEVVFEIVDDVDDVDDVDFNVAFTAGTVTETTITVNLTLEDVDEVIGSRFVKLYKNDVLVDSKEYVVGVNSLLFTGLDDNTDYKLVVTGEYLYDGNTAMLSGYILNLTTLTIGELSFTVDNTDFVLSVSTIEFAIDVVDEDSLVTSMSVNIYANNVLVESIILSTGNNFIIFDELLSETDYQVEIEYTYLPHDVTESVTVKLARVDYTTLESVAMNIISNICNERYYHLECIADIDYTGYEGYYVWAELYKDGIQIDSKMLLDNYTTYDFTYIETATDYVIKIYADFTLTSSGGVYTNVLLGTFEVSTLTAGDLAVPVVDNVIISYTATSVTVDFDLSDTDNAIDKGYLRLYRNGYVYKYIEIHEGHTSYTFDDYIYENSPYTVKIEADLNGNGSYTLLYEEGVYTPPVITVVSFEQTEMFYENDYIIMRLEIENDEEVEIDFVTINGVRYNTYRFPSTLEVLYIDMGVESSAGNYIMDLQNVVITLGTEEYLVELSGSSSVTVYVAGTMAPSDATVRVIDIVPEDYFVNLDNDNPGSISTVVVNVFLDNPYNLPVSSITIGGVTYSGTDLNVISYTEVQITADFSYSNSPSNTTLYFSSIMFERNGDIIVDNKSDQVNVRIYRIYDFDNDDATANIIHISTPADLMAIEASTVTPSTVYRLDNDIDMSGYNFIPIGTDDNPFTGAFDGNGYTITNISINQTFGEGHGRDYVGMFGKSTAYIVNLVLENVTINITTSDDNYLYIGALVGYHTSDIINVHVYNSSITIDGLIDGAVGGFVGEHRGDVINSSAGTDIIMTQTTSRTTSYNLYVGGLIGNKAYEDVRNSYATGDITITSDTIRTIFTGGLIGHAHGGGFNSPNYIMNSYATGNISVVTGYYGRTGGLIGSTYSYSTNSYVMNSFATGEVYSTAGTTGGLVGWTSDEVISSFAIGDVHAANGTIGRIFGYANNYDLELTYTYDGQLIYKDGFGPVNGSDYYYANIGTATWVQYDDPDHYIDFLGWNTHFWNFSSLDVANGVMPTLNN